MAASRQKMEFELKKELYEAIAPGFACNSCKILPREGPLYFDNGKIVCSDCKTELLIEIPGTEKLLQTLPMAACRYQKNGCQIIQDRKNISYHEEDCPVRDVECIFGFCQKNVIASEMANHLKNEHDFNNEVKFTFKNGQKATVLRSKNDAKECKETEWTKSSNMLRYTEGPLEFNGKMFYLQKEIDSSRSSVLFWLQMYGSKFEAKNYRYSVQLQEKQDLGTLIYKGPVKSLDDSKTKVFESKVGLAISFEVFEKYLDDESGLTFELEIKDLKPKDDDVESKASFNGE